MHSSTMRPAMSRRAVLAGLGAMASLAAVTGCGGNSSDPSTTLYTWISNENDRAQWQAFIDAAKEADPEFDLTLDGPSFSDYWTKVKTRMSSRDAPSLLTTQAARAQELDALLTPLEDLAQGAGVDLSQFNDAMIDGMTVDGSVRAIPYDAEPMVLFFNRSLFVDGGIELPGTTYTTDQFLDNAKALTSGTPTASRSRPASSTSAWRSASRTEASRSPMVPCRSPIRRSSRPCSSASTSSWSTRWPRHPRRWIRTRGAAGADERQRGDVRRWPLDVPGICRCAR